MDYSVDTIRLRKAMLDAGIITINELSQASNVNRNTIGGILDGKVRPSSAVIERIAGALSLSGDDIGAIFFRKNLA